MGTETQKRKPCIYKIPGHVIVMCLQSPPKVQHVHVLNEAWV